MANNNHFELTLDTLAPVGSISRGSTLAHGSNFALTIDKGDASFMYVWFDTTADTSVIPSGTTVIPAATSYTTQFSTDGTYYYHLVLEDDLGNKSTAYHTEAIQYDTTIPEVTSVAITNRDGTATEIITTRSAGINATFTDALSGCVSYVISGEIVGSIDSESVTYQTGVAYAKDVLIDNDNVGYAVYEAITAAENTSFDAIKSKLILWATVSGNLTAEEIEDGEMQKDITLSGSGEEESTKVVWVTVTDAAGNTAAPVSDTIYLDTKFLTGVILIRDASDTTTINDTWVNVADMKIALTASDKSDWQGYRVWGDFNTDGGSTGTTKPTSFTDLTAAEKTAKRVLLARKFTSGDAENKTVNAEIIDTSGNITLLSAVSADVDYTAPTKDGTAGSKPEIAHNLGENPYVSLQEDFNSVEFTPTADYNISGAYGYAWYCNDEAWPQAKGGSGTGAAVKLTVAASDLPVLTAEEKAAGKGARTFTLTVVDNAGNSVTTDGVTIYLDTVVPTGSITMDAWYNRDDADHTTYKAFSTAGATASATDSGAGMAYMTCWNSQTAADTSVPSGASRIAYAANPTHEQIKWPDTIIENNTNYIHIKYEDKVGNVAYVHSGAFGIDLTVPSDGSVTFTKEAYPSTSATILLDGSDTNSGIGKFKVWGSAVDGVATEAAASWEAYSSSKALTMTTGDGEKTANVKYMDIAGNISVNSVSDTTELDTSSPSVSLALKVSGTTDEKPATSNVKESDLLVTVSDDALGKHFYQVYGDFTTGSSQAAQGLVYVDCTLYAEATAYAANALVLYNGKIYKLTNAITAAQNTGWTAMQTIAVPVENTDYWKEFTPDSGKVYKTVATICTSGDGTKVFNAKAMDNAGNKTEATATSFVYDTTAPEVVVSGVDHNRISKVHTKRLLDESGTISELTTYNDETKFTFTPDSDCQAYKVVAYKDQTTAAAGSHADTAIPTTAGSVNMSASGIAFGPSKETKAINSTIKGADYETAISATATNFSAETSYVVGDIVKYNSKVYTCIKAHTGEWAAADFIDGVDGAHYVVVYVQDLGGTWSVAASFTA